MKQLKHNNISEINVFDICESQITRDIYKNIDVNNFSVKNRIGSLNLNDIMIILEKETNFKFINNYLVCKFLILTKSTYGWIFIGQ